MQSVNEYLDASKVVITTEEVRYEQGPITYTDPTIEGEWWVKPPRGMVGVQQYLTQDDYIVKTSLTFEGVQKPVHFFFRRYTRELPTPAEVLGAVVHLMHNALECPPAVHRYLGNRVRALRKALGDQKMTELYGLDHPRRDQEPTQDELELTI